MLTVLACITQQHDLRLVALSAAICVLGCFTTATLMAQAEVAAPATRWSRIAGAAAVFGGSVWSLHFVAMLAFLPGTDIAYALVPTAVSIGLAVAGSFTALLVWCRAQAKPLVGALSGLLLGLTVSGMHYTGVSAMRLAGLLFFDDLLVAASVAGSIVLGAIALLRADDLIRVRRRLEVTAWLTLAICGLHFTGMAAVTLAPAAMPATDSIVIGSMNLGVAVGVVSLAILVAGLVALKLQQHLTQRSVDELHRMRLLSDLAHEALFIHREGRVVEVNLAGERLFGASASEIIGKPVLDLFSDKDAPALFRRTQCRAEDLVPEDFTFRSAAGEDVPVELSCQTIEYGGKPATAVALRNLSERRRNEARIRHLALHDALTDLPNRYFLRERLERGLEAAAFGGRGLAVVYIDLDRFKPVNDIHGHAVGDALLVEVARRLQSGLRPADTLARVGGDEFVAVLTQSGLPEHVAADAAYIIETLGRPFQVDERQIEIGASAGIALYPHDGSTADALLRAADTALYRVKDTERGTIRFFEASMDAQLRSLRRMEQELALAIERDELRLYYQPIVNGHSGEIETFEALIRWQHPERGLVSPAEFIPVAEQSNLIASIGAWVIQTACAAAAGWSRPWRVSVNVSPSQFRRTDIAAIVAAALQRNALPASRLVVEITESVLIQDAAKAIGVLGSLRAQGVRLALDDFGTGYSSLSYLQRFKFDKIKVDQSFVRRIDQHGDTLTIVRAIVNLGHNLGLQVTMEGVETAEQLAILKLLHCDQLQGYLFGRPLPQIADFDQTRIRRLFDVSDAEMWALVS